MEFELKHGPAFTVAVIQLEPGETIIAEADAMVEMTPGLRVSTSSRTRSGGGILKGLRRMLAGEKFFLSSFQAGTAGGQVSFAPTLPGEIVRIRLDGAGPWTVQRGSYLAGSPELDIDMKWMGLKGLFGGEGLFLLKVDGAGELLVNAYGGVFPVDVDGSYVVDTGHIVAFDSGLTFDVVRVGSWWSTFFSGEGLVARFHGRGRLWAQTHNAAALGRSVGRMLPAREG